MTFSLVPTPMVAPLPDDTGIKDVSEEDGIELAGRIYRNEAGALAIADSRSGSLERDHLNGLLRRRLAIALTRNLPARQRLVIVRRYFEDFTLNEIAAELNVTMQHVARMQAKALERLRHSPELKEYLNATET